MYPLYMIAGSSGQGMVLPQEDRVPDGHASYCGKNRAAVGTTTTQRTDRNRLLHGQLRARRTVVYISLTPSHCHFRCQWCQVKNSLEDGGEMFFDESQFCLGASDGRVLVRRRPAIKPRHTGPTPGIMF
ncbi:transposable element Tcb2 transposase [Trichonephila clavipes]|nr:transposable element Tcb2 transposase [Trichonephila clavipes]